MRAVEKQVLLQTLDHLWREHLATLDHLRSVVGFRGYAQRDPLNEYKTESFELFQLLIASLRRAVTGQLAHVEIQQRPPEPPPLPAGEEHHINASTGEDEMAAEKAGAGKTIGAAETRRREPVDLGQGRAQRALPLRLGQEIQAVPRDGDGGLRPRAIELAKQDYPPKGRARARPNSFRRRRPDSS